MYTQVHPHLFTSRSPLLTRWRWIAKSKCEVILFYDESLVSRSSTLWDSSHMIVYSQRTKLQFSAHTIASHWSSLLHICQHVVIKERSIDFLVPVGPPQKAQGVYRYGAHSNGHRPWWLVNCIDRWRRVPDWWSTVQTPKGVARSARVGYLLLGTAQEVSDTSETLSKGV